jgi:hypothetical protein
MNEYEVCIDNILADEDKTDFAMVTSVGNNLSFTVWVDDLKPSLGEQARQTQILAAGSVDTSPTINPAPDSPDIIIEEATVVNDATVVKDQTWKVGDHCRALYSGDGLEYEATILEMILTEDNNTYVKVDIIGYGTVETVWLTDLIQSQGKIARDQQLAAVLAANAVAGEETLENPQTPVAEEKESVGGNFNLVAITQIGLRFSICVLIL